MLTPDEELYVRRHSLYDTIDPGLKTRYLLAINVGSKRLFLLGSNQRYQDYLEEVPRGQQPLRLAT
jgi:hypothetical protein